MEIRDSTRTAVVELSRAEQWVVHHVILDELERTDDEIDRTETDRERASPHDHRPGLDVIEKLERGSFEFTPSELTYVRRACGEHARTTDATADRNLASAVAARVELALRETTA